MRKQLEKINNIRKTFIGTFARLGTKNSWGGNIEYTVLLKDIKDEKGHFLTDHLWFNLTKGFKQANLNEGDLIQFDARVKKYKKGYKGYKEEVDHALKIDYKLSHPTKIKKIGENVDVNIRRIPNFVPYEPIDITKVKIIDKRFPKASEMQWYKNQDLYYNEVLL